MKKIGIIVGSLRKSSYSKMVAAQIATLFPDGFSPVIIDISDLNMYNQDLEANLPPSWVDFRATINEMDAFLFVTPEYNRSFTAPLKNALDVASRPFGKNAWAKKPAAIISISAGRLGGFGGNHHLRQALVVLNMYTMQQPELYLGEIANLLDTKGNITNDYIHNALRNFANSFVEWINFFNKQ